MWWDFIKNSLVLCFMFLFGCTSSKSSNAKIYLASSLAPLASVTQKQALVTVDIELLNSSVIAKQIQNGAACDVAVFADDLFLELVQKGQVKDPVQIFTNSLVVASAITHETGSVKVVLHSLKGNEKIIVADDYVPLGKYTKEALTALSLYENLKGRFLFAHSARHALMLLKQQAGRFAILYGSDLKNENVFLVAKIDGKLHRNIAYTLVTCSKSASASANILRQLLLSNLFREHAISLGFL